MKHHDRRRASAETRAELRSQVLALREEGKTFIEISAVTGYARTYCVTLAGKLEKRPDLATVVNRGGRPTGNGRHLTSRQEAQALRWVCGRYPDQLRLPFALWTRRAVQELFHTKFDVAMPIRTVGEVHQRVGSREIKRFLVSSKTRNRAQVPSVAVGTLDLVRQPSIQADFKC